MRWKLVSIFFLVILTLSVCAGFWGHYFFLLDQPVLLGGLFLGLLPVLFGLMTWVFKRYELNYAQKVKSAVLMALPGMIGDVFCIKYHIFIFPDLSTIQVINLASWVLWAYALVLLIGILSRGEKE